VVEEVAAHLEPGLEPRWRLCALLHDAPEYVIGDMISPFKAALGVDYRKFEDRLEAAIHVRFGLPPHPPARIKTLIKTADRVSAYFEAVRLAGFSAEEAGPLFGEPREDIVLHLEPLPTAEAQARFLHRFNLLLDAMGSGSTNLAFSTE
jgi:5'-deoxynucleotidase YfbR-like HD superfamily hydrolase